MAKAKQVTVQEQRIKFTPIKTKESQGTKLELFLRKITLAALTMFGIGYVLVNVPIAVLITNSVMATPIASDANITAIVGRTLFLMASIIAASLGVLFIFGAVKFYERSQTKGIVLLGVLIGSFYLLCLGVGSIILAGPSLTTLMLIVAPITVAASAATHTSPSTRFRTAGSVLGVAGSFILAYAIFNFKTLDLIFGWDIPFTGPFMSLTILECAVVILGSIAACTNSLFDQGFGERTFNHISILLVALVYGIGAFIGSLVLSMSFWNFIWKSPWVGPFNGLTEWIMSTVVFWSASLVLMVIGGVLLIAGACLGFFYVSRQFSEL